MILGILLFVVSYLILGFSLIQIKAIRKFNEEDNVLLGIFALLWPVLLPFILFTKLAEVIGYLSTKLYTWNKK